MNSVQWNEQAEMDRETRRRMNDNDHGVENIGTIILLAAMVGMILGILLGSMMHDSIMHRGEKIEDIRQ
jgi:hypothetical protein